MRVTIAVRVTIAFLALSCSAVSEARAQWLPNVRFFRSPIADPFTPRLSVGIQHTNLLQSPGAERPAFTLPDPEDAASDIVAAVGIGAIFPLIRVSENVLMYADARVFSRFRIEYESRDDMGQDWFVGGGFEGRSEAWSGRVAIIHRSSHLGDEFIGATGAQRIEFGSEQLDMLVGYEIPALARLYGGGSWIFRSYLAWEPGLRELGVRDRAVLQLGADREWRFTSDPRIAIFGGVDFQTAERTEWRGGFAAAAGIGVRADRSLRLMARFYDGPSTMGEFFLTSERYFIVELVAEI